MTNRSQRFVIQGSGMALAAVIAAALPAASPAPTTASVAPAVTQTGASAAAGQTGRHMVKSRFVGFDAGVSLGADIRHRWP